MVGQINFRFGRLFHYILNYCSGLYFRKGPVADQDEVWGKGWGGYVNPKSKIAASGIC